MPALENPKHEEFALQLAKGVKQGQAYIRAGYAENKGAASRLAREPRIQERVEHLRKELSQQVTTALDGPVELIEMSLAEQGLTLAWVAEKYKVIYQEAIKLGSLAAANTAVQSIQKMIEAEKSGQHGEAPDTTPDINIEALGNVLDKVTALVNASKQPDNVAPPDMLDITPKET